MEKPNSCRIWAKITPVQFISTPSMAHWNKHAPISTIHCSLLYLFFITFPLCFYFLYYSIMRQLCH